MFNVIELSNRKIRTIYGVKEQNGETLFLYFDEKIKVWKWCYAYHFEPVE